MIKRYEVKEIEKIWNEKFKFETWWIVEKAVCYGWYKIKLINKEDWEAISKKLIKIDLKRLEIIEEETKHDVVAFTRMISEQLGVEKKWIHFGLTSTDIVDTAQNYLIKCSNSILLTHINKLSEVLKNNAKKYKNQLIMGRTHGVFGEPTSLGLKFLLWYEEWNRQLERFDLARKQIEIVKISGSMGNFAHLELDIEKTVAQTLELDIDPISTQITQRDRHLFLISVFVNMASTLEKMATEIRLFSQSEINELAESFSNKQKGSSSMPHKKNPISSENICGLVRIIASLTDVAYKNQILWHERDISHSSNERIYLPEIYHLLVYTINRMTTLISNLTINEIQIEKHIDQNKGIFFSQIFLNEILKRSQYSREEVYDFIQEVTKYCQKNNCEFKKAFLEMNGKKYLSVSIIESLFDIKYFLRNVDQIYKRVLKND